MLSRVAENLYWLGRNLERADNLARLADVTYHAAVEQQLVGASEDALWEAVVSTSGALDQFKVARKTAPDLQAGVFVLLDTSNDLSLAATVARARELARELRPHLSREVWEEVNQLYLEVTATTSVDPLGEFCARVKHAVAATIGMFDNTVLLDEGREWFRCGLFLERADMTSRIIDAKYFVLLPTAEEIGGPIDRFQWIGVLRSVGAWQAFRQRHRQAMNAERIAQFLLLEPAFPRSVLFCVMGLSRHFSRATAATPPGRALPARREIELLHLDLNALSANDILVRGLHEFLDDLQRRLVAIDEAIRSQIFRALPEPVS
jgi:uncharacterized alpha-E superfamily protein